MELDTDAGPGSKRSRDRSSTPVGTPPPPKKARQDDASTCVIKTGNRPNQPQGKKPRVSKKALQKLLHPEEGTPDDVLWHEICQMLGNDVVEDAIARKADLDAPVKFGDILELQVDELSSSGAPFISVLASTRPDRLQERPLHDCRRGTRHGLYLPPLPYQGKCVVLIAISTATDWFAEGPRQGDP